MRCVSDGLHCDLRDSEAEKVDGEKTGDTHDKRIREPPGIETLVMSGAAFLQMSG